VNACAVCQDPGLPNGGAAAALVALQNTPSTYDAGGGGELWTTARMQPYFNVLGEISPLPTQNATRMAEYSGGLAAARAAAGQVQCVFTKAGSWKWHCRECASYNFTAAKNGWAAMRDL
jgi:hypothetical protein